jgi:Transposase, Mutator family
LRGVKLVISDDQSGRRQGLARQLATLPRVHFMRNVLAHAGRQGPSSQPPSVLPSSRTTPRPRASKVADPLRPKLPKLAALLDEAEADLLAFMSFCEPGDLRKRRRFILLFGRAAGILPSRLPISQPPRTGALKADRICGDEGLALTGPSTAARWCGPGSVLWRRLEHPSAAIIIVGRGRPRGEAWRVGCKRHRTA